MRRSLGSDEGQGAKVQPSTLLVSSGLRFCEAIGLQPSDFDFEAGIPEVARSVVKVSRQHHPQGKTFLVRDYTKNGQTRRLKLDRAGTWLPELAVELAGCDGLIVSAVSYDDMAGYELEATLVSAPHHDPIVIGRSRTGDHCQVTLERWLPIDGEPGFEDAVNEIRAILAASARPIRPGLPTRRWSRRLAVIGDVRRVPLRRIGRNPALQA